MILDPDALADRRRLKRRLGLWRIVAALLAVVVLAAVAVRFGAFGGLDLDRPHVARLSVQGMIVPDRTFLELVDKVAKSEAVKGVIVAVDSPGGATSGGEALYAAVRGLAGKKPTVAYIGSLGTSAGYMTAIAADHVVARGSALTGSIGVLMQWPDVSKLMDTVGVRMEEIKSSPMKAEPSPFKPTSPEGRAMLDRAIRDSYEWFVGLVAERRGLSSADAHAVADGRVVTGRQALALKLIDAIGEESVARDWLTTAKSVDKDLPIRDWKPKPAMSTWPLAEAAAEAVTRGVLAAFGLERQLASHRPLDGLRSDWHLDGLENAKSSGEIGR
jgi:protease-4